MKKWLNQSEGNPESNSDEKKGSATVEEPKYLQPKILLVDTTKDVGEALQKKGYNIAKATLGTPFLAPKNDSLFIVEPDAKFPNNYKEQEIVVLDLHYDPESRVEGFEAPKPIRGVDYWWTNHKLGKVNPRCLNTIFAREDFDRILLTGGVFIIFADRLEEYSFYFGNHYGGGFNFDINRPSNSDNWNFLTLTNNSFSVGIDHGEEIFLSDELSDGPLKQFLLKYIDSAKYECTLAPRQSLQEHWVSLLENKYDDAVGCAILPTEKRKGLLFVFPDIFDKATFTTEFIDQILPAITPELFPFSENASWINSNVYEFENVQRMKEQIANIRQRAEREIATIEGLILEEMDNYSYLYDLTRSTGDALVKSVIITLKTLGFAHAIDVDEELAKQGIKNQNREDIQIHDNETVLVIEVKGISNHPSDDDALTVQKYVVLRMKEWEKTTVQGVSIINHQKHLPPLDRDNEMPFRQEILDVAVEQEIGLITGWDLHRLARSYIKNNWAHENIRDLFYQTGRISPIPTNFEFIGTIQGYIKQIGVVGIQIEAGVLQKGDRIAFELPVLYEEQACDSMQIDNLDVNEAIVGTLVGIKTHLPRDQARSGTRVYLINT